MTKAAAIEAMAAGYKVRHRLFSRDEYIWSSPDEDYYIDESGYLLPESDFWDYRKGVEWETGWEIAG